MAIDSAPVLASMSDLYRAVGVFPSRLIQADGAAQGMPIIFIRSSSFYFCRTAKVLFLHSDPATPLADILHDGKFVFTNVFGIDLWFATETAIDLVIAWIA